MGNPWPTSRATKNSSGVNSPWVLAATALAGVAGHNYPAWLRFSGGKGVATSFGVLFFLDPLAKAAALAFGLAT